MNLVRLAVLDIAGLEDYLAERYIEVDDVTLKPLAQCRDKKPSGVLVAAYVPLPTQPVVDGEGAVQIPDASRRLAENAIETVADRLSVLHGRRRSISSTRQTIAFQAEGDELSWLQDRSGINGADSFPAADQFTVTLADDLFQSLVGRDDGVAVFADVMGRQQSDRDQFRALIRFFERAFALSSGRLVVKLAEFLEARPGLGYTKTEVKHWVERRRGPAVHADRSDLPIEADFRPLVPRMKFAAYDALLNKAEWHDPSTTRRIAWSPLFAPRPAGGLFAVGEEQVAIGAQFLDPFGAYTLCLKWPSVQLPEDHWPREYAPGFRAEQQLQVVDERELRVESPHSTGK